MKEILTWVALFYVGTITSIGLIYGFSWLAKIGSYNLFYKDMVRQTVIEMVSPEALKNKEPVKP